MTVPLPPMFELGRIRILVAAVVLLSVGFRGAIVPALADWRFVASGEYKADVVAEIARRYPPLVASLPARGLVGYLQPNDWPAAGAQLRFYLAEYSLTPRIVVMSTAPDYVIVAPEASLEGDDSGTISRDPRLAEFVLLRRFDNGLRVFRRNK